MIRSCVKADFDDIYAIINDAAEAYRGIIPEDRWKDPYMSQDELQDEIDDGVMFWGFERSGELIGVMGLQDKGDVILIRHAYVRTRMQNKGIGSLLLLHLEQKTDKAILIGTWAAADWAIRFYEKHGYRLPSPEEKDRLLRTYWSIPERQIETSVVLANEKWFKRGMKGK
jgi:GNAT superfamily N-acetyltransferase